MTQIADGARIELRQTLINGVIETTGKMPTGEEFERMLAAGLSGEVVGDNDSSEGAK